jgi:preprotein translocase subunit SecE
MKRKSSPLGGLNIGGFLNEVRDELRQVTWPTKKNATNMTLVVIGASVITGAFLGSLDYLFLNLIGLIIR